MVRETAVIFKHLTRLIDREDFVYDLEEVCISAGSFHIGIIIVIVLLPFLNNSQLLCKLSFMV